MRGFLLVLSLVTFGSGASAASPTEAAVRLYEAKQYPAAIAALSEVLKSQPDNAEACYYLGMSLRHRGDAGAYEAAAPWLERAAELEPGNADYLADFAGNCLELADKRRSYALAVRGRDAMEKALVLDPKNLDGRFGLVQFYAEAPWPLGNVSRAFVQAGEIARSDRAFGLRALTWLGRYLGDRGNRRTARRAYEEALRLDPGNPQLRTALAALK